MYRSTQAMHMLTKPQVFYDDTNKQALGYQNPFHLKKAQRIQPTLYDFSVIAKEHALISMINDEETLILEEESRSKMLDKQNDPISIEKNIKISPIDYSKLNIIKEDFVKSHTPVRVEAPSELPKLKDRIKSLSGKDSVENVKKDIDEIETINIELEHRMFKLDIEPISHRLKNNRDAHEVYIKKTIENTDTLHGFVERARTQNPSEPLLESACMCTKHVQELLVYVSQTCPNSPKHSEKLVAVTPMNKDQRVRFAEPVTSPSNIPKQTDSLKTTYSNKPLLASTGVKPTTSASGSKPSGNTKNNRITQPPSSNQKNKVVQIVLWYLDSECSKHMTGNCSQLMNFVSKFLGTVRFRNDQVSKIIRHNLFSVGQFCDADLEVAFWKNTYFIRNLEGVDIISGSKDTNLYTISLDDMLKTSPICLLSKASKTKSWLWNRRLLHLNFGTLNKLAKDGLARGIPNFNFQKDHLCSACALRKSKKSFHQPKAEDTNQEKLYLLHMDLCGPMRVESINEKKYILVIVDDYSRFT
ncbi:retrovirus-related pol polyprotein from transposon TNT 1-94 [Tanacetum coccineum]